MANVDSQLVREIADQVLAALRRQGGSTPAAASGVRAAEIHAPAGVCTGDYSKFAELRGQVGSGKKTTCRCGCGGQGEAKAPGETSAACDAGANALRGIVTANQLRAAMGASGEAVALVADDARLTPLAQDLAREKPGKVRRVAVNAAAKSRSEAAGGTWVWWREQQFATLQGVVGQLPSRLKQMGAGRSKAELACVVREMAGAVRSGRAAGGVLFVSHAAKAGCFVNRCTSLRAVVGTCVEAVRQGMDELGANVLIVEVPYVEAEAIHSMVKTMTERLPAVPGHVEQALKELGRCE